MTNDKDREVEPATQYFILIGKFITTFSQIEFYIRVLLGNLLKIKNDEHFNAVVGPYDFAMLCTVTATIFQQEFPGRKAEIEEVIKRCRALNDDRVRIVHAFWTFEIDGLMARHLSRNSLKRKFYYQNPEKLKQLAETAQQLKLEVLALAVQFTEQNLEMW